MTKKRYTLAGHGVFTHDGEDYRPGDPISLDEETARRLAIKGRLADIGGEAAATDPPADSGSGEPETAAGRPGDAEAVIARITEKLPELPPEAVAKDGRPVVAEVERLVGFDLTEDEVDYAWRLYREARSAASPAAKKKGSKKAS